VIGTHVAAGVASVAGYIGVKKFFTSDEEEELSEEALAEMYSAKGPEGTARSLKKDGWVETRAEALELIEEFEEENSDVVTKYKRRAARRAALEAAAETAATAS
jgi:rubrerythrin